MDIQPIFNSPSVKPFLLPESENEFSNILRGSDKSVTKTTNDESLREIVDKTLLSSLTEKELQQLRNEMSFPNMPQSTASSSPQSISLKDMESTIESLKKENFSLKLRLFYMSESMRKITTTTTQIKDSENIQKILDEVNFFFFFKKN